MASKQTIGLCFLKSSFSWSSIWMLIHLNITDIQLPHSVHRYGWKFFYPTVPPLNRVFHGAVPISENSSDVKTINAYFLTLYYYACLKKTNPTIRYFWIIKTFFSHNKFLASQFEWEFEYLPCWILVKTLKGFKILTNLIKLS